MDFDPGPIQVAAEAVQYGATLAPHPDGLRWGGALRLHAATGDFTCVRPSLSLPTTFSLPGPLVTAYVDGPCSIETRARPL